MAKKQQPKMMALVPASSAGMGAQNRAMAMMQREARQNAALEVAARAAEGPSMLAGTRTVAMQAARMSSQSVEKLLTMAKDKNSRVHVAGIDMAGSLAGVLSFEAINWLLRKLEDIFPSFAENTDLWQSLPHLILGMAVYWGELLTRTPDSQGLKVFPSMPREIAHEWSKAFTLLGASNLWRALRVRRRDAKSAMQQKVAYEAEIANLNAKVAELQQKLDKAGQ